jgi:hypothetical protein
MLGFDLISPYVITSARYLARRLGPENLKYLAKQLAIIHGAVYITYSTKAELITMMYFKIYILSDEPLAHVQILPLWRPALAMGPALGVMCWLPSGLRFAASVRLRNKLQGSDNIHSEIAPAALGQEMPGKAMCLLDLGWLFSISGTK